ncbi:MAG: SRPBCC domain-containing protein [Phycisphaerales bacterium]
MTDQSTAQQSRTIALELEIDAPIEDVWKALTEADQLKSWFPYDARVTPGKGGSIWLSWGPECEGEVPITIWDPPNQLQSTEHRGPFGAEDSIAPVDITTDYHLNSAGGKTVLRLVQAGLGPEREWDGEYNATAEDWPMFLAILSHYVPNHAGVVRRVTNIAATIDLPASETWSRLFGSETPTLGSPYKLKLAGSLAISGVTKLINPGRRFVGTLANLNNAVFVLTIHDKVDKSKIAIELSTYDVPADQIATTERQWTDALNEL